MTGNTKVWRAPLAGLASVAMIATMSVAASTANAATDAAKLTFDFGNQKYSFTEGELQTTPDSKNVNGKIDSAELAQGIAKVATKASLNTANGDVTVDGTKYTLTGFSDGSGLEAVLTDRNFVQPRGFGHYLTNPAGLAAGDVTLSARLQKDPYTVTFKTSGVTTGGVAGIGNTGSILLAQADDGTLDLVPSWAVPTTEQSATDHKVAYKLDGTLADKAVWKVSGTTAEVKDPTASSLYADAFEVNTTDGTVSHKAELTLQAAPATVYKFRTENAVRYDSTPFTKVVDDEGNEVTILEAATGETLSAYMKFPTAVLVRTDGTGDQSSREWYTTRVDSASALNDSIKWDESKTAGTDQTLYAANATNSREVTLHYNDASNTTKVVYAGSDFAPETPANVTTSSVEYKFAGWYTDSAFTNEFVQSALGNISNLYAKWDIAAVKFVVDPNYGTQTSKAVWVNNGANFKLPVASDYRSGWTATVSPNLYVNNGKWYSVDNFNLYAAYKGAQKGHAIGTNVKLQYQGKSRLLDLKTAEYTSASWDFVPGQTFTFSNWSKATVNDLNTTLSEMKKYVTVKKGANYIKGSDQDDFTAASFDQYVSDYQEFLKNNGTPKTVADYQSQIDQLAAIQAKLVETSPNLVYRAYNPNTGDHYFTTNKAGYDALVKLGWHAEGTPYAAIANDNGRVHVFGTAIYSAYNPNTGEHLLTVKSEAEDLANYGWKNEGVAFYAPQGATESVYRLYNPNTNGPAHVYTGTDEYNGLVKIGWRGEDLVFKLNSGK